MNKEFQIEAKLIFNPDHLTAKQIKQSSWKSVIIAEFEGDDLLAFYRWLIKKRYNLDLLRPIRKSHLTILNDKGVDQHLFNLARKRFEGKILTFTYTNNILTNGDNWWLKVCSEDAEMIRTFCGVRPKPYFDFHLTFGRAGEGLRLEHSKYISTLILNGGNYYI
jgi:hypothetical protein